MNKIGDIERNSQNRIVELFEKQLGYRYLGNWEDRAGNSNVEEEILRSYLSDKKGYDESLISKALYELNKVAGDQTKSLYEANKEVYSLLRYGVKVKPGAGENTQTIWLIDWKNPLENDFAIAEEVTINGKHSKRPDIVLYVNGIALGVLEMKRSTISVAEGIRQNLDNQKHIFIQRFFTTVQFVMAGQDLEGMHYGTIETKEKYYLTWKEESEVANRLDRQVLQVCNKERFLELIHDFVVFDRGDKKLCRHNQYFGVKAAQEKLKAREGGIIWHTQGSGKSLTMVWLTRWIQENIDDSRVLIITDREELDEQIEKVFKGVDEQIYRTKSGEDLIARLDEARPRLLCSLIHKFGRREGEEPDYDGYIEELRSKLPKNFKAKGKLYVMVDECHRTQSGKLHEAMKMILPDALFIGFTGTPLLKKDKQKSIEVFGPYIHTYKFNEAVADKVVLDLRYEARDIEQKIDSHENIDLWFDSKTKGLTEFARTELKQKWGTVKKVFSSKSRLEKIVADIMLDMATKERLQNGRGNALLVSGSIYNACRYFELFQTAGLKNCAIVTSYKPTHASIKGEESGEGLTEKLLQYDIYQKMLNGKDPDIFEDEAKAKFVDEPAQMKLLIVVDKLLTGFDAPSATYLYIDKSMKDHGLFQAICRVNRLDGDDKEYGYIIDYKDLFNSLEKSITDYTSEAFDAYEKEDVAGLLENRLSKGKEKLDDALEVIKALCEPVPPPKGQEEHIHYFCGNTEIATDLKETEPRRVALYKCTISLIRAFAAIADEMEDAGYSAREIESIKKDIKHFENLRKEGQIASGDYIDLKQYEPAMRHLIDSYISAEGSKKISALDDFSLVQLIVERGEAAFDELPESIRGNRTAMAETIENNLRRVIIEESVTNPIYYERMSVLLDEIIRLRKEDAKNYAEYLKRVAEATSLIAKPNLSKGYPTSLKSKSQRAFYDNLNKNEGLALTLDEKILSTARPGWLDHTIKGREVKMAIEAVLKDFGIEDETERERIVELARQQSDYRDA